MKDLKNGDIVIERVPPSVHPDGYAVGMYHNGVIEWLQKDGKLDRYQYYRLVLPWEKAIKKAKGLEWKLLQLQQ